MLAATDALVTAPFPGLRPFTRKESQLYFGREDQCDDLLHRLGTRRLVAVVGASGAGKSSLVHAGLIPSLRRGYIPTTASSWRVAICRPGDDPLNNLAGSLAAPSEDPEQKVLSLDDITWHLDSSSLGLATIAHRLVDPETENLLVLVDQFEELFAFIRRGSPGALDTAATFAKLLTASMSTDAPLYIVLTMRSDYLGDCARFAGLPEALNDSQFLVPQMTRAQMREAIEGPVHVCGADITPRLVQQILNDVEKFGGDSGRNLTNQGDPLPLLQHALMRVWDVSADARVAGLPIDLEHYTHPRIQSIRRALDLHADEVYGELKTSDEQRIATRVFQRLTERDAAGRDTRRRSALTELTSVALGLDAPPTPEQVWRVEAVIEPFSRQGRSFLFKDSGDYDISHETLIRQWKRLGAWVEAEATSARTFTTLCQTARRWQAGMHGLLGRRELKDARTWWRSQEPTTAWSERYSADLDLVRSFLRRSRTYRDATIMGVVLALSLAVGGVFRYVRDITSERAEKNRIRTELAEANNRISATERARADTEAKVASANVHGNAETARAEGEAANARERASLAEAAAANLAGEAARAREALARAEAERQRFEAARQAEIIALRADRDQQMRRAQDAERRSTEATQKSEDAIQKLSAANTTIAELNAKLATAERPVTTPDMPSLRTSDPSPAPVTALNGTPETRYRAGVNAYNRAQWARAVADLDAAIELQRRGMSAPATVSITGTTYPYAPYTYLALALARVGGQCSRALSTVSLANGERRDSELQSALNRVSVQCSARP